MHKFLRQYRNTPHSATQFTPFRLIFGRDPKTKLPEIENKTKKEAGVTKQAKQSDQRANDKAKKYADCRNKAKNKGLKVGDRVLVKNEKKKKKKLTTPHDPSPLVVKEKKGSMVTASSSKRNITRNASFFKKLPSSPLKPNVYGKETTSADRVKMEKTTTTTPTVQEPQASSLLSRPVRARKPPT